MLFWRKHSSCSKLCFGPGKMKTFFMWNNHKDKETTKTNKLQRQTHRCILQIYFGKSTQFPGPFAMFETLRCFLNWEKLFFVRKIKSNSKIFPNKSFQALPRQSSHSTSYISLKLIKSICKAQVFWTFLSQDFKISPLML